MTYNYKAQEEYKGKIIKMADHAPNMNPTTQPAPVQTPQTPNSGQNIPDEFKSYQIPKIVFVIIVGVLGVCVTFIGWLGLQVVDLLKTSQATAVHMTEMQEDINELKTSLNTMQNGLNGVTDENGVYHSGLYSRLSVVESKLNIVAISTTPDFSEAIPDTSDIPDSDVPRSPFPSTTSIGTDSDGNKYIAKDLVNQPLLLTYEEDNKVVYFYGQYNENYNWDGYCITNVYNSNGTLYGICESNFEDGKRVDYKTVLSVDSGKWDYYERNCDGNSNNGISISYAFEYDKVANFTTTNVRVSDILDAEKFLQSQNKVMLQYYSGATSNGKYNDTTGNAYHVKYDEDGTVKTLYVGHFKNGTYNDTTGNAWDIAYSEDLEYYVCNTGSFKNGNAVTKSKTQFTQEEINEKISEYEFDCKLKWKETE